MYVTSPFAHIESEIEFSPEASKQIFEPSYQVLTVKTGNSLFFEGDDAEYMYEILEGVVRSSKVLMDGRRQVINFGYPGDLIGLSHNETYHCDCDAVSDVKVRVLQKHVCSKDLHTDSEFCAKLLQKAVSEVTDMQEHFIMLGRKTAIEKLASFLVTIMDRESERKEDKRCFDLPMSRADIADFLALTIETVSRNLTNLRKQGVIDLPNTQRVCVLKPTVLRELAENDI